MVYNVQLLFLVLLSLPNVSKCKTVRGIFSSRLARLYQGQYLTKFCFYGKFYFCLAEFIGQ